MSAVETALAVAKKARIYIIELSQLLPLAHADACAALPQPAKQVKVPDVHKAARTEIGRKTAAVRQYARCLFFDIHDQIGQASAGRVARRLPFYFDP